MTEPEHATDAADAERWKLVGAELAKARQKAGLSKRAAATRAGFSEVTWRQLEDGERQIARGMKVPVSPRDETLVAAARAVGLRPDLVFEIAGRAVIVELEGDPPMRLSASGVDLAELAELDPEGYQSVVDHAQLLLRRARERKGSE